jgi:hypothetical protein
MTLTYLSDRLGKTRASQKKKTCLLPFFCRMSIFPKINQRASLSSSYHAILNFVIKQKVSKRIQSINHFPIHTPIKNYRLETTTF